MIIEENLVGVGENCYSSPAHRLASILAKGADTVVITVEEAVLPIDVIELAGETEGYSIDRVEKLAEGILRVTLLRGQT